MPTIRNHILVVDISAQGAELQRIYNKETKLEYLWNGDEKYWPKHSPVLFPVVGELKDHTYRFEGKTYQLNRHGFARDMMFEISDHTETSVTFTTRDTPETLQVYPFPFTFSIQYTIDEHRLYVINYIENTGDKKMYFSLGAHPAFNVPLADNTDFDDYYLEFSQVENAKRYTLSADGLIEQTPVDFFINAEKLPLQKSLFYNDALLFKDLQSASIAIRSNKTSHGLTVYIEQFPYLGIWSKKDANFVCIEPWCGIADSVTATGELQEKEGIIVLEPKEIFEKQWSVELF